MLAQHRTYCHSCDTLRKVAALVFVFVTALFSLHFISDPHTSARPRYSLVLLNQRFDISEIQLKYKSTVMASQLLH
jgi:hypothetical protein